MLLSLIGSIGDIGTQVAVMTAMSFGAMDGADRALLPSPGPQVLVRRAPRAPRELNEGDNRETRPFGMLLAVTVALYALSLSDVNATWMHTRKESMLEMKEALKRIIEALVSRNKQMMT